MMDVEALKRALNISLAVGYKDPFKRKQLIVSIKWGPELICQDSIDLDELEEDK